MRKLAALLFILAACKSKAKPTLTYGQVCASDSQCISGRCLESAKGEHFCSETCKADADCFSDQSLYCCEFLGTVAECQRADAAACPAAQLGDTCAEPNDPLCLRAGLECATVDAGQVCTKACSSITDCSAVAGVTCGTSDGRNLCNPPSSKTRVSNCGGDSDCPSGQLCQVFSNNDAAPTGLVTQCSTQTAGPQAAFTACTQGTVECDVQICSAGSCISPCVDGFCPSSCVNDSYCPTGFSCRRIDIELAQDKATGATITGFTGFCAVQKGSFTPCPRDNTNCDVTLCTQSPCPCTDAVCPAGESCGYFTHYDGSSGTYCQTDPSVTSATDAVVVGDVCSPPDNNGDRSAVVAGSNPAAVRVCAATFPDGQDACFGLVSDATLGYCSGPCQREKDCPSTQATGGAALPMHCVYFPFEEICAADTFNDHGAVNGTDCTSGDVNAADALCQTFNCDTGAGSASTNKCIDRLPPGSACQRPDQCFSFNCGADNTCLAPCGDSSDCPVCDGTHCSLCDATPFPVDVNNTPNDLTDDVFDLPTFCESVATTDAKVVPCRADATNCSGGEVCRSIFTSDGGNIGVCATPPASGKAMGTACTQNSDCDSNLCLGQSTSACSAVCADDTDCAGKAVALRCIPVTLFGRAVNQLCLPPTTTAVADGGACTSESDCQSNICAEGKCAALCPAGSTAGANGPVFCVPTPLSVDLRFTNSTVDDRVGYVLAEVASEDCTQDNGNARCVFRPTPDGKNLLGFVLTPDSNARPAGAACRLPNNCESGLCVAGACATPCDSVAPSCPAGTCTAAQALVLEDKSNTATVNVCL